MIACCMLQCVTKRVVDKRSTPLPLPWTLPGCLCLSLVLFISLWACRSSSWNLSAWGPGTLCLPHARTKRSWTHACFCEYSLVIVKVHPRDFWPPHLSWSVTWPAVCCLLTHAYSLHTLQGKLFTVTWCTEYC